MRMPPGGSARRLMVTALAVCLVSIAPVRTSSAAATEPEPPRGSAVTETEATREARSSGQPVEVLALRGESREVRALPSGTFELVQHQRPVRTRKDGAWTQVNPELTRLPGGGLGPIASTVDLRLSEGGSGPFVTMGRAGRTLSLSWPKPLPAPVVEGDTATYPEVLPGVDLSVRADVDGFSHLLVVKTPEAARNPALARLRLRTESPDLDLAADAAGVLRASDKVTGGEVFEAPAPLMWDSGPPAVGLLSDGQAREAGPVEGSRVERVGVGLARGELALVPDRDLLTDPGTHFPVYIDPVWKTVGEAARLMVSSGYPTTTYYNWSGTQGVGLCDVQFDGACVKDQKKRLFFRMPISAIAGKVVLSAEFIAYETHAYNCSNPTSVQLWHASGFGSSSTWNSTDDNWIKHLTSRDVAYCSRTPVEFGGSALLAAVKTAVTNKDTNIYFGLRAYSESTMAWWKRFTADADLRIQYNTPPPQPLMKNLSMSPGGPCVSSPAPTVNRPPIMYAVLTDPDSGSAAKLQAQFRILWDDSAGVWDSPLTEAKTTGSTFQMSAPPTIPQNKLLGWHVRAWDGYQWSPWSSAGEATGCYFSYDAAAPPPPSLTSADYPPSDPDDPDDPWYDGVGRYGSFTVSTTQSDVNRYWVGINTTPTSAGEYRPATPGGPVTIQVAPTRAGVNFLYVKALDAAGNASAATTYMFRVNAGAAPRAHWSLDEPAGATSLSAGVRPGTGAVTTKVSGGVTLGVDGQVGTAMHGDGSTGYAETSGPVVDTSKTYSVGAWVKLAHTNGFATAVNQDGNVVSGFYLQYVQDDNRWSFSLSNADAVQGGVRVRSVAPPEVGEWTHLLGVYDAVAKTARLYVNGVLQEEKPFTVTWNATGPMAIGRAKHNGAKVDFFPGEIDDVQVFDRLVSAEEAADLFSHHPVLAGRWTLNTGGEDGTSHGRHLTMAGDAHVDQVGWLGSPPGALVLDGAGDYAATAGPVISTSRSFTVAGWVTAAGRPTARSAVFSQAGAVNSGFTVRYDPSAAGGAGGWQVEMPDSDASGAAGQRAEHSAYQSQLAWDHVAVVYDSFEDVLRLYVNGWLEETEERVSVRWHTVGFDATGAFQLGRAKAAGAWGEYWPGAIDDVWAFSGVLSQEQIQTLAGYTELPSDSPF
ncbi:LamG domain-containing protein [Nonomuraea phyllanthi]|uniref:LamG-like jellyroll fold domain-containing protein n=1 Tax=Nonomuraea phyllanthi TaxID=2219224 RepID=UPI0012931356|nr:LamG-like jellyroll fold domain-containing protein [Nonomuraea phyllanthi]QFY10798.1 LamG domain-containing protein [Nonomuraea phyllanthi]